MSERPFFLTAMLLGMVVGFPVRSEVELEDIYADHYEDARAKFLAAVKAAEGKLEHHRNPHLGSKGEALYTDVATFNLSGAQTILVLGSGTHGVEGFAGSAIQVGLLREGITEKLPEDVGLLFYHALNPYGFSHLRRFNEDSVDLNRNFVDHAKSYPVNDDYNEIAWLLEPTSLSAGETIKAKVGAVWYRMTKGARWLQSAISRGQYNSPKGLFYGGAAATWSNQILENIVLRHLAPASRVILIDFHTGLGEYGAAEVITELSPGTSSYEWMTQCWDTRVTNPHVGDAVSPSINGSLKQGFTELLPNAEVIATSLEFGTYSPPEVLWALRAENYVHHHGGWEYPGAMVSKDVLKQMFYPQQAEWKAAVWNQGAQLVRQTLACLH